jgi:CheY-like chemotaxis protein
MQKPRVLVVEDTDDARDVLARMLRLGGFQPVTAENGSAALTELEKRTPDVVLLDLMMPHMNGVQLLDRMRHDPRWADLPVVLLTAVSEGRLISEAAELGVQDIILKGSVNAFDLIDRISKSLRTTRPAAQN